LDRSIELFSSIFLLEVIDGVKRVPAKGLVLLLNHSFVLPGGLDHIFVVGRVLRVFNSRSALDGDV
jgi:hypothetical protein